MTIELQNNFVIAIARSIGKPWDEVFIEYANSKYEGIRHEIYQAYLLDAGVKHEFTMTMDALNILVSLQDAKPLGQEEQWKWFEFKLQRSGKYKFEFKYDDPPLIVKRIHAANLFDARQKTAPGN